MRNGLGILLCMVLVASTACGDEKAQAHPSQTADGTAGDVGAEVESGDVVPGTDAAVDADADAGAAADAAADAVADAHADAVADAGAVADAAADATADTAADVVEDTQQTADSKDSLDTGPVCVLVTETCNGVDDDCDGETDEVTCDDTNPCTDDLCDKTTGCAHLANTATCTDDSACTSGDGCSAGACIAQAVSCDDANPCTDDLCDKTTGCAHLPNTATCTDDSACTSGDGCSGGNCTGTLVICAAKNDCTPASCDVSAGCVGQPDVQLCNDANTCTKDACGSSGCTYLAQSGPCNDGNPCTPSDACSGGKCLGTGVLSCNDNNVCTLDSCKAGVGCQNAPVGLGAACSDGDVCNGAETCVSGACKLGSVLDCDDKDACTTDSCNKTSGCKHAIAMKPWTFLQNGMDGGAFTAIDADPLDAKVVYAGGKGLFRSADGGASWTALSGLASRRISSVKVDLATPGTLYITGVYPVGYYLPDGSDGFFASTDSGKTWKAKNTGLTGATLNRIVLDPADSASLYLVTDKGLFHSSDTGGSWQIVSGMPTVYIAGLAIDPTGKTLLVLGGKPGSATTADVYRSLNGGATFTALGTLPANLGLPRDIAVGPTGTWFAVCSDGGVLRSNDAGSTWALSSSGMAKTWYGSPASMQWLTMDSGNGSRLWVGTNAGIHRSSDGGVTWKWVQAGLPDLANQGMVAHSDPTDGLFVLTSGRGVFRSDDLGATWIAKSQGLQGVIVSVVAVVPGSTSQLYAMAAFGGQVYRSQDGGKTWADTLGTVTGTPISLSVAADGPGVVYAGIGANSGPKLFKTVDFGKTWKATALAPCTTTADYMRVTADPTAPGRVLASSDACGLSWSEDGGANWSGAVGPFGKLPVRVTFDADTPDRVLTASYGLYESKDGGKNWLQVGNGPGLQGAQLAVAPGKPLVLLATGYALDGVNQPVGRVSRSLDGGKTWQQTSADFDRGQPAGIAFDPTRPGYVYVGTANTNGGKYWDGGVFVSGDGGLTWTFGVSGKVTNLALLGGTVLGVGGNYGSNASFTGVGQTELVCQ